MKATKNAYRKSNRIAAYCAPRAAGACRAYSVADATGRGEGDSVPTPAEVASYWTSLHYVPYGGVEVDTVSSLAQMADYWTGMHV